MDRYTPRKPYRNPYIHISREILKVLATGAALCIICSSPTGTRRFLKDAKKEWKNALPALDALQRKKLVSFTEKRNGMIAATITREGKRKIEKWNLDELAIPKPRKWDGIYRVVAFDIAEKRRKARGALRDVLKRLDFMQLQKSLLVHPYPCEAEIELLQEVFNIPEREVLVLLTRQLAPRIEKRI